MNSDTALRRLARAVGLMLDWHDATGLRRETTPETLRRVLGALGLPVADDAQLHDSMAQWRIAHRVQPPLVTADPGLPVCLRLPPDRYRLTAEDGTSAEGRSQPAPGGASLLAPALPGYYQLETAGHRVTLAVAPEHGLRLADACPGGRAWGLAVQLYSLRRTGDGGFGDYTALADFAVGAAGQGADAIALSPVHAQFTAVPTRFSPYAPSSRLRLDIRHADAEMLLGELTPAFPPQLADEWSRLEALNLIDWPAATAARLARLRQIFDVFQAQAPASLRDSFSAFRAEGGAALERHARFEALQAVQLAHDPQKFHWRDWGAALRDPESPAVADFAAAHAEEVDWHAFLQWQADRGLAAAQRAAREAGARIGLVADLAIGVDGGGSDAWSRQDEFLQGVEVGAPPDIFNRRGQGWGITTYSPHGLRANGFAAFREMLGTAFRNAGGVRLDHVLGLRRLWLVPEGATPDQGCYLRFPLRDLLRLVALESARHQAVAIGEDLGTVPDGLRPQLERAGLAGMRVMWFEQTAQDFTPPQRWTQGAVAMTSTHDLPTVAGWWEGRDLAWREELGFTIPGLEETRAEERPKLWDAFCKSGVAEGPVPGPHEAARVADAAAAHIGRARCELALLPLEDAVAAVEQPNLPGTVEEHPNWRRRLAPPVERMFQDPAIEQRLRGLARARRAP
ncbi:4-alpha-glucanotransferase [Roseomonas sp. 18066]|uniref:4-alpha-glucanotransferase n=1 Tax=Roseomonas sp. 18066 TaxID=2681412 RepID=UPI001357B7D6|nr:4-alpha-glucanotransferase [Roseomonas sp. 18066]